MLCLNCGAELDRDACFCAQCKAPAEFVTPKKYYIRSNEEEKFQKKKGPDTLPCQTVKETGLLPGRSGLSVLVSALLAAIFAAGLFVSGWFFLKTGQASQAPLWEAELSALDESLTQIKDSRNALSDLKSRISDANREIRQLQDSLKEYRALRDADPEKTRPLPGDSYEAIFSEDFFVQAYQQYIDELLQAFMQDTLVDQWFYTYYAYAVQQNADSPLVRDVWIYDPHGSEAEKFSPGIQYGSFFCSNFYTADLLEHLALNERLYVTGSDMLSMLFYIPGYALDNAVFVRFCGGNPDPEKMLVPNWTAADYRYFWEVPDSLSDSDLAIWEEFGLSAGELGIDWNSLFDEQAYYNAYLNFMDTVAPGLERLGMAQYLPDDTYYGGFRCSFSGSEPSLSDIAAVYAAAHPERFENGAGEDETDPGLSCDEQIRDAEKRLAELNERKTALLQERYALEHLQRSEAAYRDYRRALLLQGIRQAKLIKKGMYLFGFFCCLLLPAFLWALIRLIRSLGKPGDLFLVKLEEGEIAFPVNRKTQTLISRLLPPEES